MTYCCIVSSRYAVQLYSMEMLIMYYGQLSITDHNQYPDSERTQYNETQLTAKYVNTISLIVRYQWGKAQKYQSKPTTLNLASAQPGIE